MKNVFFLKITSAEYVHDYILKLTFNDGAVKLVDFTPLMQKGICRKLQYMNYFRNYTLDPYTVDWNNENGFAPETLYERGIAVSLVADFSATSRIALSSARCRRTSS